MCDQKSNPNIKAPEYMVVTEGFDPPGLDRVLAKMERPALWPDPPPFTGVVGPVGVREAAGPDAPLTAQEIGAAFNAIQRRLYSISKLGVKNIEDIMVLPFSWFYKHNQSEAVALQAAGEKLCRMNLAL